MLWETEVGCWDAHPLFEIEIGNLELEVVKISFHKKQFSGNLGFMYFNRSGGWHRVRSVQINGEVSVFDFFDL